MGRSTAIMRYYFNPKVNHSQLWYEGMGEIKREYVSQIEGSHGGVVHGFSLKLGWAVVLVLGEPKR